MSCIGIRRSDPKQFFPDCYERRLQIMKRALSLLAVSVLTATSTGCNCCPCLRNICPWGACGSSPAPVATYAAVPAPVCGPTCGPTPVYAAAPAPVFAAAPQQFTVPQYAAPAPQPVYSEAGCSTPTPSYACEPACGVPYTVADPGCGYMEAGYGGDPSMQGMQMQGGMMVDPAPAN
jgi:hypothetical protein